MKNVRRLDTLIHAPTEHAGLIGDLAKNLNIQIIEHHLYKSPSLPALKDLSGLVVMGGPMNVDETNRYPFLEPETALIKNAIDTNVPVMGICLGSQLIAKALARRVFSNHVREVGWKPVELLPAANSDPLFKGIPSHLNVLHWHGDTFDLPEDAVHLAKTDHCANQAFRFKDNVYGLQFHLEVTPKMVREWVKGEESESYIRGAGEDSSQIVGQAEVQYSALKPYAEKIFERFLRIYIRGESHKG